MSFCCNRIHTRLCEMQVQGHGRESSPLRREFLFWFRDGSESKKRNHPIVVVIFFAFEECKIVRDGYDQHNFHPVFFIRWSIFYGMYYFLKIKKRKTIVISCVLEGRSRKKWSNKAAWRPDKCKGEDLRKLNCCHRLLQMFFIFWEVQSLSQVTVDFEEPNILEGVMKYQFNIFE